MSKAKPPKAVGSGLITLDLIVNPSKEILVSSWVGGTCGNVLTILGYLGWDVYPVARMNGGEASSRILADMGRWGVHLDFARCEPACDSPIVVQELRQGDNGESTHRFSWLCPCCRQPLPRFRPILTSAVPSIAPRLHQTAVFFFDRLSRAALELASLASAEGATVVFEPSTRGRRDLFDEAIQIAHVVKYSAERLSPLSSRIGCDAATILEVQTLGSDGLRYRHHSGPDRFTWKYLGPLEVTHVVDTCGSGDWCTAGLLARAASGGQKELATASRETIEGALRFGQALAAWNCAFKGARGGMYRVTKEEFTRQVDNIRAGRPVRVASDVITWEQSSCVSCPACAAEADHCEQVK